jgi:predicted TPR repeat methyltransferase
MSEIYKLNKKYFIKQGYLCNFDEKGCAIPYLDNKSSSEMYQTEVYKFAKQVITKNRLRNVLDIGCGFGEKLEEFIYPACSDITGVDAEHSVKFCKQNHAFGKWHVDNIENSSLDINKKFDLIISSDVIEHLINPDKLLFYIKKYSHDNTFIIISTPERDMLRGKNSLGPPENKAHVREWNVSELQRYIESRGFKILKHFLVKDRRRISFYVSRNGINLVMPKQVCQVVYCKLV